MEKEEDEQLEFGINKLVTDDDKEKKKEKISDKICIEEEFLKPTEIVYKEDPLNTFNQKRETNANINPIEPLNSNLNNDKEGEKNEKINQEVVLEEIKIEPFCLFLSDKYFIQFELLVINCVLKIYVELIIVLFEV